MRPSIYGILDAQHEITRRLGKHRLLTRRMIGVRQVAIVAVSKFTFQNTILSGRSVRYNHQSPTCCMVWNPDAPQLASYNTSDVNLEGALGFEVRNECT